MIQRACSIRSSIFRCCLQFCFSGSNKNLPIIKQLNDIRAYRKRCTSWKNYTNWSGSLAVGSFIEQGILPIFSGFLAILHSVKLYSVVCDPLYVIEVTGAKGFEFGDGLHKKCEMVYQCGNFCLKHALKSTEPAQKRTKKNPDSYPEADFLSYGVLCWYRQIGCSQINQNATF